MAIIVYCVEKGGYGDLVFGLKLAASLRRQLIEEHGYCDAVSAKALVLTLLKEDLGL